MIKVKSSSHRGANLGDPGFDALGLAIDLGTIHFTFGEKKSNLEKWKT